MTIRGRPGVLVLAAGLIISLGAFFWLRRPAPARSERQYATQLLAEFLKETVRPKKVLVFGNSFADLPNRSAQVYEFEKAGIAGLRNGFGNSVTLKVGHPHIKSSVLADPASVRIDPSSGTPLSFMIESSAFDELLKANPDCDLAVSLIGLPVNLSAMDGWTRPGAPCFALLLPDWRMIGDAAAIQKAFASGKLVGAVVQRPGSSDATDLRQRYVLVSSNNIAEMLQKSPQTFGY